MSDFRTNSHFDPVLKLKLGWVTPLAILTSGEYVITDVESTNRIWFIFDPRHGFDEYFILENRWPGTSYERNLPDSGIAIWHVIENSVVNSDLPRPTGTPAAQWSARGRNWERRAIRLIRSGGLNPPALANDAAALWGPGDGTKHLRWVDGTQSGISVRVLTNPNSAMTVRVRLPLTKEMKKLPPYPHRRIDKLQPVR
jgi:hypothetical protein